MKNFEKVLAIFEILFYNISCVQETQGNAPLAQLAEHLTLNQGVQGSNPWWRIKVSVSSGSLGVGAFFISKFFSNLTEKGVV